MFAQLTCLILGFSGAAGIPSHDVFEVHPLVAISTTPETRASAERIYPSHDPRMSRLESQATGNETLRR